MRTQRIIKNCISGTIVEKYVEKSDNADFDFVVEKTEELIDEAEVSKNDGIEALASGSLLLVIKNLNHPVKPSEIAEIFRVAPQTTNRTAKKIFRSIEKEEINYTEIGLNPWVTRCLDTLYPYTTPPKVERKAKSLAKLIESGETPEHARPNSGRAAAIVYLASIYAGQEHNSAIRHVRTQKEVANSIGTTPVVIRDNIEDFEQLLGKEFMTDTNQVLRGRE
ncbi:MAG: hypothetical protein SVV03_02670 [Candidatus Nanohaloarchaea archaeon]|nr:hypothetical protein [Candidatus Nanohaloarchaea archaeon]